MKGKILLLAVLFLVLAFFVRPPVTGGKVSSWYGIRVMNGSFFHTGTDFALSTGLPIKPISGGTVKRAGFDDLKGNYVTISHLPGVTSEYQHMDSISVNAEQKLSRSDLVGTVGNTGNSTGSHLHLEIRLFGIPLPAGILSLPGRLVEKLGVYEFLEGDSAPGPVPAAM